jgi:hypothetical protein
MQWKTAGQRQTKAQISKSKAKIMMLVFFDIRKTIFEHVPLN